MFGNQRAIRYHRSYKSWIGSNLFATFKMEWNVHVAIAQYNQIIAYIYSFRSIYENSLITVYNNSLVLSNENKRKWKQ